MQSQKKHLLEGLIQAALLLSLCGLRVDVGLDLGPDLGPLAWSESLLLGPTSALTPTHLHNLRNALEGGAELHPKHPDLDAFFTSRRLLGWVRSLDRLQVPQAELETWLVQLDPTPLPVRLHHTAPNRFILPEQTRDQDWTESGEEPREMEWEEPEDTHTQVYRRQGDTAEDMSPAHTQHIETQGTHGTQDWGREEPQDRGQAEDDQSSASLQECLRLLEGFPLTQEQQELVCNSGAPSTALAPLPAEDSAYMDQQWQDLLDLLEPQTPDVDMVDLLEQTSQLTPAAQGGPLMDGYLQHGAAASDQELLPFLPSDQLDDPTPAHLPSPLSSSLLPAQLLLGEEDLDEDLDGELEELLGDAQMLEEMSLLDLALEEGFGEELNERLEEQGYMDPEFTQRTSQLSLMSRDQSRDKEEDVHTILPDVEEELDSDSGLSLDSSHSPASPSHSEASSYSSSSSSSSRSPVELQVTIKEEPLDDEELGAVGGHYNPQHESKHAFSSPFHPDQKLFEGFPWLEQISHDHTYNQPSQFSTKIPSKHLKSSPKHEKPYHLPKHIWSRDEKRARALKIPFSNELIINLPVEEFNDLLANYELNEDQLNLVRDIRRRGKNKIAAQNCRKRKMDTLQGLQKDVTMLRRRKSRLLKDNQEAMRTLQEIKQRLTNLYQDVFSSLRDGEGRPLDVHEYMLSFESDGSVDVVSRRQGNKEKSRRKQKDKK